MKATLESIDPHSNSFLKMELLLHNATEDSGLRLESFQANGEWITGPRAVLGAGALETLELLNTTDLEIAYRDASGAVVHLQADCRSAPKAETRVVPPGAFGARSGWQGPQTLLFIITD